MTIPNFSLRRRVQLCIAMLAFESFISFEEIFMLAVLQRVSVPVVLVSLPGTISSAIGVFVIPFLGWASDRGICGQCCGQKRPFALFTLCVTVMGMVVLVVVSQASLYSAPDSGPRVDNGTVRVSDPSFLTSLSDHTSSADIAWAQKRTQNISLQQSDLQTSKAPNTTFSLSSYDLSQTSKAPNTTFSLSGYDLSQTSKTPNTTSSLSSDDFSLPSKPASIGISSGNSSSEQAMNTSSPVLDLAMSTDQLSLLGIMGILGFVLSDHGYDSSMSTFKSYMISVTPGSQHDEIFVMTTLAGAIGGCLTSLLGFVDLSSVFPATRDGDVLDSGIAQCLLQALVLLVLLLVLGTVSLSTGTEDLQVTQDETSSDDETGFSDCKEHLNNNPADGSPTIPWPDLDQDPEVGSDSEKVPLLVDSVGDLGDIKGRKALSVWRRWKKRVLLCVMTFLGLCTNYSYFVYVTNYVGEVIYEGDPNGDADSDSYKNYVQGVHVASLGMLTFYCLFVVFNLFHHRILEKIGMRKEYFAASVVCAVLMLSLAFTNNIIIFFVNSVSMAIFRSAVYTVPFMLSNNYAKEEYKDSTTKENNSSGVAMASISAMIPASYFLVSLLMGPLLEATGYPGTPVLFAAATCVLGMVSAFFVDFN